MHNEYIVHVYLLHDLNFKLTCRLEADNETSNSANGLELLLAVPGRTKYVFYHSFENDDFIHAAINKYYIKFGY